MEGHSEALWSWSLTGGHCHVPLEADLVLFLTLKIIKAKVLKPLNIEVPCRVFLVWFMSCTGKYYRSPLPIDCSLCLYWPQGTMVFFFSMGPKHVNNFVDETFCLFWQFLHILPLIICVAFFFKNKTCTFPYLAWYSLHIVFPWNGSVSRKYILYLLP